MSISVSDELQLFAQEIQSFLSPNILQDLARGVGFMQRTSKYQVKVFPRNRRIASLDLK
ncbi:hypothetical protein [Bacillus mycoides]|uniref:hypothetical protein n=1 Tax=Bacillus mycoides TaxID=1405 RepID=UPI001C01FD91|nr:hypothetical protein [Bacillus mycoides]